MSEKKAIRLLLPKDVPIEDILKLLDSLNLPEIDTVTSRVRLDDEQVKKLKEFADRLNIPMKTALYILYVASMMYTGISGKSPVSGEFSLPYYPDDLKVTVVDDVEFFVSSISSKLSVLKKVPAISKLLSDSLTILDVQEASDISTLKFVIDNNVPYLHSSKLPQLEKYVCAECDLELRKVLRLFIYNPDRNYREYGELSVFSFEYTTLDFLEPKEFHGTSLFLTGESDQDTVQKTLGSMMDTVYLTSRPEVSSFPIWAFEDVSELKRLLQAGEVFYNPFFVREYRVAPVETLVPADRVVDLDYRFARLQAERFRRFMQGVNRVWFGKYKDLDVFVYPSGYFLVGLFPPEQEAVRRLKATVLSWINSGGRAATYNPDYNSASAVSAWYPHISIPSYSVTSSIAWTVGMDKEVAHAWNECLF